MLTIANEGGYMVKKCQKPVYVICEGSLNKKETSKQGTSLQLDKIIELIIPD